MEKFYDKSFIEIQGEQDTPTAPRSTAPSDGGIFHEKYPLIPYTEVYEINISIQWKYLKNTYYSRSRNQSGLFKCSF